MPMMRMKPMVLDDSVEEGSPTTASKEFQAPHTTVGMVTDMNRCPSAC